jgi:serine/threonine protein kinase
MIGIKFVRRYSDAAHKCCAELGFAPQLFGFQSLPGGWSMVVMDWLSSDKWSQLDEIQITRKDVDALISKISQLHQSGYGHGDLRAANILVSRSDPKHYMIIDFDWAGTLGIVCYPMNVNKSEIWRPDSVVDEAVVLADHDLSMLEHMYPLQ